MQESARTRWTGLSSIISVVIIALLLILLAICLIVMRFGIINNIEEGMTNIGTLKVLGYRNWQIILSILLQFGGIAAFEGILGVVAAQLFMPLITSIFESQTAMIWNLGFDVLFAAVFRCVLGIICYFYGGTARIPATFVDCPSRRYSAP